MYINLITSWEFFLLEYNTERALKFQICMQMYSVHEHIRFRLQKQICLELLLCKQTLIILLDSLPAVRQCKIDFDILLIFQPITITQLWNFNWWALLSLVEKLFEGHHLFCTVRLSYKSTFVRKLDVLGLKLISASMCPYISRCFKSFTSRTERVENAFLLSI